MVPDQAGHQRTRAQLGELPIDLIPQMIRDSGLFVVSLLMSLSDFMWNALIYTAVRAPVTSNSTTPFIEANLQCIGNTNYRLTG